MLHAQALTLFVFVIALKNFYSMDADHDDECQDLLPSQLVWGEGRHRHEGGARGVESVDLSGSPLAAMDGGTFVDTVGDLLQFAFFRRSK